MDLKTLYEEEDVDEEERARRENFNFNANKSLRIKASKSRHIMEATEGELPKEIAEPWTSHSTKYMQNTMKLWN